MTISNETLTILSNFSGVNQSILVHPGNKLSTISASKNILAHANIEEEFETEFAIYDLSKFLGVLKLYEEADFEFNEEFVIIRNKKNARQYTRYYFSNPSVVIAPPKDKKVSFPDEPTVEFSISQKDLQNIVKGCSIMSLPDVDIKGTEGEKVMIEGLDANNKAMGTFNQETEVTAAEDFSFTIAIENLTKLMQGDYTVALADDGIARFSNSNKDVTYFIAVTVDGDEDDE